MSFLRSQPLRALLNSETAKQEHFYTAIILAKQEKKSPEFFQLAKQDICTSGFCIQLSIYINIESVLQEFAFTFELQMDCQCSGFSVWIS